MNRTHPPLPARFADEAALAASRDTAAGRGAGLYDPRFEHESCGVGFVCHIKGHASHRVVDDALRMLENMSHRGACGCEPDSGDGSGLMVRTPDAFLRRKCMEAGFGLPPPGEFAAGMVFLPPSPSSRRECEVTLEETCAQYGMRVIGWRDVPIDSSAVGPTPRTTQPVMRQVFVGIGRAFYNKTDFDRRLYLVRQRAENITEFGKLSRQSQEYFYITSLSTNRMIYKGMLTSHQLRRFFPDLSEPDFTSALALVHSRFSTNTAPSWRLAHPYRYLAHNGEINTLRGNRNWMRARYGSLRSEVFGDELDKMRPILTESGSDSATLDNALQFLCVNGRSLPHAVLMMIPEAWQNHAAMDPDLKAFYEYHACMMEPWDGPASIAFTNGHLVGAVLDRNGLRPSRYVVTKDDLVIMSSEVGALPVGPDQVARKWRLQPGRLFLVDMDAGRIVDDEEIKRELAEQRPWKRWLERNLIDLEALPEAPALHRPDPEKLLTRQHAFGYTLEDLRLIIGAMGERGEEPVGSMGNDAPLAVLSDNPQLLYSYFRQLFAQVTNPPLDAIREELVTSLFTYLGREGNLLAETPRHAHLVKLSQPILGNGDLEKLRQVAVGDLRAVTLPMLFSVEAGEEGLRSALGDLCVAAAEAVSSGASILVLSDRGVDREHAPIPSLLATAAVHQHLIAEGTRTQCGLVVETGEAREPHHFCLLIGYGAGAINPYLVFETLADLAATSALPEGLTAAQAGKNFIKAANKAILKIASKMGISTVQSYRGAQIFEAIGLSRALVDRYFTGTPSRLDGVGLGVITRECLMRHRRGYPPIRSDGRVLHPGGAYQFRRGGEEHAWNPDTISRLQHAVRTDRADSFEQFSQAANDESRRLRTLRGLLRLVPGTPVPLEQVEPASAIVRRFVTGAMSFGSISREAHEALAVAMNRLGGKSNTGEGGEDPDRYRPLEGGGGRAQNPRRSAIKQVASARFGVTAEYLVNADELQIKMAQGAKPGEGGQLPGHKVDEVIARVRHSTPGVGLISPPPHHDIYSIEDLAQLIHDLKNVNPAARISVKLVSEVGVGTVAAGVAKAKADHILVSGDSGGTGASPLGSIKHAGLPWELGLAETQQVLVMNGLRGRVVLQTDGQIKTGRDVVVAALLGAEEVGFSTAPLVALGCVMMRVCHLNTCPVGIATQDPELRKKFAGAPEHVVRYMFFVAEEVRALMAELGFRRFEDMVGQTQHLALPDLSWHWKARHLDLSPLLAQPPKVAAMSDGAVRSNTRQDHGLEGALDHQLLELAEPALSSGGAVKVRAALPIRNVNRAVGAMLSGRIAERYGHEGLPPESIRFDFAGSAGQSFGAFLARGVTLTLAGDANDYVGKGLSGGRVAVMPPPEATFVPEDNIIAGNVIGYGAIAGELFLRGVVGERFCVRNSGALAVVEGVGDHGCEYMTGGRVLVLGPTGRNFAAGMSGGIAWVLDVDGRFASRVSREMVELEAVSAAEVATLKHLLAHHAQLTGSTVARAVLDDFEGQLSRIVQVMPRDYRRVLAARAEAEANERRHLAPQAANA